MALTPIAIDLNDYTAELRSLLSEAKLYDSSCSSETRVIFIDKDTGYFLKSAVKGKLEREAAMTEYFHRKGLSAEVLTYIANERDWMLTAKVHGEDCTAAKYLEKPERLCDMFAERLTMLHTEDFSDCPIKNHTERYLAVTEKNKRTGNFDKNHFPDSFGYRNADEAWSVVESQGHLLQTDTLLHGDYCLPNIILDDWRFSGFIDLKNISLYKKCGYTVFKTEEITPGLAFVYMEKYPTRVREITPADYPLLEDFIYHAIFVPPGMVAQPREIIHNPDVFIYIDGLGSKPGDCGVVAEVGGKVVGAAWERIIPAFGHVDDDTPELAVSVLPEYRGRSVGTAMMTRLFELLRERDYKQTSLAV